MSGKVPAQVGSDGHQHAPLQLQVVRFELPCFLLHFNSPRRDTFGFGFRRIQLEAHTTTSGARACVCVMRKGRSRHAATPPQGRTWPFSTFFTDLSRSAFSCNLTNRGGDKRGTDKAQNATRTGYILTLTPPTVPGSHSRGRGRPVASTQIRGTCKR